MKKTGAHTTPCGTTPCTCGCCEGIHAVTPYPTENRPGLNTLLYRVGTHAGFLETMKACLSLFPPLKGLTTREGNDASIAMLDGWAAVADVLTFYQERIVNEGYIATATERRSVLELSRMIGYSLRPGVASSVFLAYTIDPTIKEKVRIPAGAASQSIPNPGENAQTFETSDELEAQASWNILTPRRTRPQTLSTILNPAGKRLYIKGTSAGLSVNDVLLVDPGSGKDPLLFRAAAIDLDPDNNRTLVALAVWPDVLPVKSGVYGEKILNLSRLLQDTSALKMSAKAKSIGRIVGLLKRAEKKAASGAGAAELAAYLNSTIIKKFEAELGAVPPGGGNSPKIRSWMEGVLDKFRAAAQDVPSESVEPGGGDGTTSATVGAPAEAARTVDVLGTLTRSPSTPPRSSMALMRSPQATFGLNADIGTRLFATLQGSVEDSLGPALSGGVASADNQIRAYVFRLATGPFGQAAPRKILAIESTGRITSVGEWPILERDGVSIEETNVLWLEGNQQKIQPGSWITIDMSGVTSYGPDLVQITPAKPLVIAKAKGVHPNVARAEYGIVGRATRIDLDNDWLKITPLRDPVVLAEIAADPDQPVYDHDFQILRNARVHAQSEELDLADEPIDQPLCGGSGDWIELDGWFSDLKSGRWMVVRGERADVMVPDPNHPGDVVPVPGISASELVMLSGVLQDIAATDGSPMTQRIDRDALPLPGEKTHSFIKFANNLSYCYKRDTVTIYGNVVRATNGETRKEVLGGGDASQVMQTFALRQPPLTFVSAPNARGVDSSLRIYVNDVQWHESESPVDMGLKDRKFLAATDDGGTTQIAFGNGERGARLPTGVANVRAEYRNGIGLGGNVKADQISLLTTRPSGVKGVSNPLRASGGADRESRDQARENAPLSVTALDRLVSVQDFSDFARQFGGVGKACATRISNGKQKIVCVTIAGAENAPIDRTSDLYLNLLKALGQCGDPSLPVRLEVAGTLALILSANIRIHPDYVWDNVEAAIRTSLITTFGFERQELGEDVPLSKVISALQGVQGVHDADVDLFCTLGYDLVKSVLETQVSGDQGAIKDGLAGALSLNDRVPVQNARFAKTPPYRLLPAEIAIFSPEVPDTIILTQVG